MIHRIGGLFILGSLLSFSVWSQTLKNGHNIVPSAADDTNKVLMLNNLAESNLRNDLTKSQQYAQESLSLSRRLHYTKGEFIALNILGDCQRRQGNYIKSMEFITQSLKMAEQANHPTAIANNYRQLSLIYSDGLKQYTSALNFSKKALQIYQETDNQLGIANAYSRIARIYGILGLNLDSALLYITTSIRIAQKLKDDTSLGWFVNVKGEVYEKKAMLDSALYHFKTAIQIFKKMENPLAIAYNQIRVAHIYLKQGNSIQALTEYEAALRLSQPFNAKEYFKDIYGGMSQCYALQQDSGKAYLYGLRHNQLKDSLFNQEIGQKMTIIQMEYEKERQNYKIRLLEKEKILAEEEKWRYIGGFSGGIGAILIILALIFYNNYQQRKANLLLQEKNREIALQAEELQVSNEEVMAQRDSLEEKVYERTQNLQIVNEKLRVYAFSNSHKVRRPVATILGLLNLFDRQNLLEPFNIELLDMLQKTAQELDDVTREINQSLEDLTDEES